jgi:hypothetical protein
MLSNFVLLLGLGFHVSRNDKGRRHKRSPICPDDPSGDVFEAEDPSRIVCTPDLFSDLVFVLQHTLFVSPSL